jgi:quinol monooxygenase YgiN
MARDQDRSPHPATAADMLAALVGVPGALKLVTPVPRDPDHPGDPRDPRSFVWEDVVAIEAHPYKDHLLRAVTAEDSWCDGTPDTLLAKLQDWRGR